ncbi:elongation factor G [Alisedimentitalea sp. MJ-SS2]|uniref:elongation factor G n=1 Tax=Aliisedimentitalea sp. MJ-SS2 TaxID=3049795 RepID=UPI00290B0593|nr:elongation factor G [Alisedimentitalea sp. MJ-SS2]MDU8927744.1 elongation factor G [Alisedimentitalea sp. MJ-SS2]
MRAFAVIGPSQSGKSTLVQALAGLEGAKPKTLPLMGGASVTKFNFMGDDWAGFYVPGGLDNISQVGPVLAACDVAVLCVPAEADAAVLSAPYLRLLEDSNVPSLVFVNGIDAASNRIADIISELQHYCAHGIILRQVPMRKDGKTVGTIDLISERAWEYHDGERSSLVEVPKEMFDREQEARAEMMETLADFDDHLLEEIIEDQKPPTEELYEVATRALQHHDLIEALLGSAENGNGVLRLMKSLRHEVPQVDALRDRLDVGKDVIAISCLADNLKHVGKAVLVRALADGVAQGAPLGGDTIGTLDDVDAKTQLSALKPGEIGLAIKSDHLTLGTFLTAKGTTPLPDWAAAHPPALQRVVIPVNERDETKLPLALSRISEVDLGLQVAQDASVGHMVIGVGGPLHLRRIIDKLDQGFGIKVEVEEVATALRETIRKGKEMHHRHRKQSGGAGQFADVVIDVEPLPMGGGFEFAETVKGGAVPRNYFAAVEAGAKEALQAGPSGHPVVDVKITLKDGKTHSVDSSDFAFRTAGKNAVREALSELGTVVLQPIMAVEINVPSIFAGGLVQLVSGLKGQVQGFESDANAKGWEVFRALLPMAALEELSHALGSTTRGTAWFATEVDHYEAMR